MLRVRQVSFRFVVGLLGVAAFAAADATSAVAQSLEERAKAGVDQAHAELWRRFVDEHDTVLDYVDHDGKFVRPDAGRMPRDEAECVVVGRAGGRRADVQWPVHGRGRESLEANS